MRVLCFFFIFCCSELFFVFSGPNFREEFLTKLINAERMAMYAPDFVRKMYRTRKVGQGNCSAHAFSIISIGFDELAP